MFHHHHRIHHRRDIISYPPPSSNPPPASHHILSPAPIRRTETTTAATDLLRRRTETLLRRRPADLLPIFPTPAADLPPTPPTPAAADQKSEPQQQPPIKNRCSTPSPSRRPAAAADPVYRSIMCFFNFVFRSPRHKSDFGSLRKSLRKKHSTDQDSPSPQSSLTAGNTRPPNPHSAVQPTVPHPSEYDGHDYVDVFDKIKSLHLWYNISAVRVHFVYHDVDDNKLHLFLIDRTVLHPLLLMSVLQPCFCFPRIQYRERRAETMKIRD